MQKDTSHFTDIKFFLFYFILLFVSIATICHITFLFIINFLAHF